MQPDSVICSLHILQPMILSHPTANESTMLFIKWTSFRSYRPVLKFQTWAGDGAGVQKNRSFWRSFLLSSHKFIVEQPVLEKNKPPCLPVLDNMPLQTRNGDLAALLKCQCSISVIPTPCYNSYLICFSLYYTSLYIKNACYPTISWCFCNNNVVSNPSITRYEHNRWSYTYLHRTDLMPISSPLQKWLDVLSLHKLSRAGKLSFQAFFKSPAIKLQTGLAYFHK